jgi:hypothetical protein
MLRLMSSLFILGLSTAVFSQEIAGSQLEKEVNELQELIARNPRTSEEFDLNHCVQTWKDLKAAANKFGDFECEVDLLIPSNLAVPFKENITCSHTYYKNFISQYQTRSEAKKNNPFEPKLSFLRKETSWCDMKMAKAFTDKAFSLANQSVVKEKDKIKGISVLKNETIQSLLNEFLANPYLPYEILETGNCYERADFMAIYLAKKGVIAGQIRVEGELTAKDKNGKPEDWSGHTALYVLNPAGTKMIIDPSLSEKPLTQAQWSKLLMTKKGNTIDYVLFIESKAKSFTWKGINNNFSNMETMSWALINDIHIILKEGPGNRIERAHDEHYQALKDYAYFIKLK